MPYLKGESGNPAGRPKGSKNRSTIAVREMLSLLIEENLDNMSAWLSKVGEDDPKAAFQCMLSLLEFHVPKISRMAHVEHKEEPIKNEVNVDELLKATVAAYDDHLKRTHDA